ncbi:MAG: Histidine-tRNA ligase [Candidatus Nomurabacteria bacterium GW2011_GWE1_32_28]|uniref:Histidine--tRNA ligase n=1 Tax=Candidatus Nomurabacteria bacterium GW2011_GWF1_31_48 TaxID=1618767 RepID=A0A0F9YEN8_9BACT|nr:MAG: Histidine-tRNA ligase [Candidatus Nomurabacteria bacterium GW2011_GWF2_30_133]KKP28529.1 MAG: Histidine-tRNA ligase [Candidatus Nomurabacteria bacterium GW2011_GWE2_31_40]KKP30124.1 MAG: Histidine-tRNA ligase [Candidatus Nomurabacteria bacterium GW2011_GWF1_31_48]KKP34669.1 MAG: Histidine-tRNA ligase [Candidatus Nomurabacteria bacterium GW2011_GWE1_32_28]HAS80870.1 histidine--tRNA ligase [Candidatus Nomurabacteria bacterium]
MKKIKQNIVSKSVKSKNKNISSPKGMRDIVNEEYYNFQGFFEKAQEVAVYYGFKPIETPMLEHIETFTSGIGEGTDIIDKEMYTLKTKGGDHLALRPEQTASLMRSYIEKGMQNMPQPVMFYQYGPVFRHDNPQRGRYRQFWQFDLDSLGSDKSIIDALVIKAGVSILEEAGATNLSIDINSIGDKECRNVYLKELTSYYKKHINNLAAIDRERLKTNPLRILDSKEEKTKEINENAPDAISFLCAPCKKHFKEVLEYLEEMNIQYNINKNLVRGLSYYTRTVFEIIEQTGSEDGTPLTLAGGGRYDYLARQLGNKKDVPAVGFSIGVDRIIASPWYKKLSPRIIKKPKIYFIQLGSEAKLKSLNIIEILRKAHIPIAQSLSKDSLGSQLAIAEKLNVPYALIFGVKEAITDSVIVRDMSNRSQETVKLSGLLDYLKEIK